MPAGNLYPVTDAHPCFLFRERVQVVVHDNPLGELGHVDAPEQGMEVRLAGQDDLQLQRFSIVQIGQKPQFFEQV